MWTDGPPQARAAYDTTVWIQCQKSKGVFYLLERCGRHPLPVGFLPASDVGCLFRTYILPKSGGGDPRDSLTALWGVPGAPPGEITRTSLPRPAGTWGTPISNAGLWQKVIMGSSARTGSLRLPLATASPPPCTPAHRPIDTTTRVHFSTSHAVRQGHIIRQHG